MVDRVRSIVARSVRRFPSLVAFLLTFAAVPFAAVPFAAADVPRDAPVATAPEASLTCWTEQDGLVDDHIDALAFDADGRPWVGTRSGLSTLEHGRWRRVALDGLPEGPVSDLELDGGGGLWVAIEQQGVARLDGYGGAGQGGAGRGHERRGDEGQGDEEPGGDEQGVGVLVVHRDADLDSLRSPSVTALADDGRHLWVGTRSGLDRVEPGGRVGHQLLDPLRAGEEHVTRLVHDRAGRLWVGLHGAAGSSDAVLEMLDLNDPLSVGIVILDGGPRRTVHALVEDAAATVWIGSEDGLFAVRDGALRGATGGGDGLFERVPLPDALVPPGGPTVRALAADGASVWVGTPRGVARLDAASGSVREQLDVERAMGRPTPGITALAVAADGALWIGTGAGLCRHGDTALAPKLHVEAVEVLDAARGVARFGAGAAVELVESQGFAVDLGVEPVAPRGTPGARRVSYRLDGFDDEWRAGSGASIHYASLPAGRYTLRIRGSGAWEQAAEIVVPVSVRRHLWRSSGAYVLYGLLIAALITGIVWSEQRKVELEKATHERLRELDRLKDDFLINTARQLFGPLHRLVGLAESLLQGAAGELPKSMRKSLVLIIDSAWRLNRTVGDLSRFSGGAPRHQPSTTETFDLQDMVERVASLYRPLAKQHGIDLVDEVAADLPLVSTDPEALDFALKGLLGHTLQNLAHGRLVLSVAPTISDEGSPYLRLELSVRSRTASALRLTSDETESQGLRRSLEEISGGTFSEELRDDGGLSWRWLLPASDQRAPSTAAQAANPDVLDTTMRARPSAGTTAPPRRPWVPEQRGAAPWRVLVVDDEEIVRHLLESLLRAEGFETLSAATGEQALELVESETVDLMLVDIRMPGLSGYQVCQTVRRTYSMYKLPVIFLTGLRGSSNLMQGLAVGGNDYLTKPLSREELLARLDLHLSLLSIHRSLERTLEERSAQVQTLWKLMPLCAVCGNRFRDLDGSWCDVEQGLEASRLGADGLQLCGDCEAQLRPDA